MDYEVLIVGGSVAGLSAALVLGRCGRRVLVVDDGRPRNARSRGVHGFITRDGVSTDNFLAKARRDVSRYPTVAVREAHVRDVERIPGGFRIHLGNNHHYTGAKLLLATGLIDELPSIAGIDQYWGQSVFVCPLCDAWEVRGQRFVLIGHCPLVYDLAFELQQWASDVVVCTDGTWALEPEQQRELERQGIEVQVQRVLGLEGDPPQVRRVRMQDGSAIETRVVFLTARQRQRAEFVEKLGCALDADGAACASEGDCRAGPDLWIAGNASRGLQMAIIAASEGVKAAHSINECLVADRLTAKTMALSDSVDTHAVG